MTTGSVYDRHQVIIRMYGRFAELHLLVSISGLNRLQLTFLKKQLMLQRAESAMILPASLDLLRFKQERVILITRAHLTFWNSRNCWSGTRYFSEEQFGEVAWSGTINWFR